MPSSRILTPADIVETARSWLGTRWVHQGRTRAGVDCCGLVIKIAHELKLSDYDTRNYARRTAGDAFVQHFTDAGLIPKRRFSLGDVIVTTDSHFPCHCGIVSEHRGEPHFIHAFALRRQVVEEPLSFWKPKIFAIFGWPGVN